MYLLDSNVLIDASRRYYHQQIAPSFWTWLEHQHDRGVLASVAQVKREINDGDGGDLTAWADKMPGSF